MKAIPLAGLACIVLMTVCQTQATSEWPKGSYGLPRTNTGCPVAGNTHWHHGVRYHDTEDKDPSNNWISGIHFDGTYGKNNMEQTFCMKTDANTGAGNWPAGTYCIFKMGACPTGFRWGQLYWDDEDDGNRNSASGVLPDGHYDWNTRIEYCCRDDAQPFTPISLPSTRPFYLFRFGAVCQKVAHMSVREEWFKWDDEDKNNANECSRAHPFDQGGRNHQLHYCYYS